MTSAKLFLTTVVALTSLTVFAQTVDLRAGYRFDYSNCYPPAKKKDQMTCVVNTNMMMIDGRDTLIAEGETIYANTQYNRSGGSRVHVRDLSFDHTIVKDEKGYTDSTLAPREIWKLKMETNSHKQAIVVKSYSKMLGADADYSYLLTLEFPTKEAAEEAWKQIRDIRYNKY